jgi:tetratricopeptide (TPR) repeat protein
VTLGAVRAGWRLRRAARRLRLAMYWQADGDLDEAAAHAHRALRLVRSHPTPPVAIAAEVAMVTARVERDRDRPGAVRDCLDWTVTLLEAAAPGPGRDRLLARVLVEHGDCDRRAGRWPQATETLDRARRLANTDDADPALLMMLGIVAKETGAYERAAHFYGEVQRIQTRTGACPADAASLQHNLAGLAHARRDYTRAEVHARRAVALRQKAPMSTAVDIAADTAVLAAALAGQRRYDEARELFTGAMATCAAARPARRYEIAVHIHNLAAIDQASGRLGDAERGYRRALALKESLLGGDHPEVGLVANNLAVLLLSRRRDTEAAELLNRALSIAEHRLPPGHPTTLTIRHNKTP